MNIDKLREEITSDEGCRLEVYLDHMGYATVAVGHLITEHDPEFGAPVSTPITQERCDELFDQDIAIVVKEVKTLVNDFDSLDETVQHVLCNLLFNMGKPRLSKFKKFLAAINRSDWVDAGKELKDSRYYTQVTNRADRLIARLNSVGKT
tara:strand:- start:302 stop:751 length:450 start_codon:yes stop_codon:yes gene_type:complete